MRTTYIQDGCAFCCRDAPHKIRRTASQGSQVEAWASTGRCAICVGYGREEQGLPAIRGHGAGGAALCTFFRRSCTENVAETQTHRDVPLDMLHVFCADAF